MPKIEREKVVVLKFEYTVRTESKNKYKEYKIPTRKIDFNSLQNYKDMEISFIQ